MRRQERRETSENGRQRRRKRREERRGGRYRNRNHLYINFCISHWISWVTNWFREWLNTISSLICDKRVQTWTKLLSKIIMEICKIYWKWKNRFGRDIYFDLSFRTLEKIWSMCRVDWHDSDNDFTISNSGVKKLHDFFLGNDFLRLHQLYIMSILPCIDFTCILRWAIIRDSTERSRRWKERFVKEAMGIDSSSPRHSQILRKID